MGLNREGFFFPLPENDMTDSCEKDSVGNSWEDGQESIYGSVAGMSGENVSMRDGDCGSGKGCLHVHAILSPPESDVENNRSGVVS
jgi:hypothetical protein